MCNKANDDKKLPHYWFSDCDFAGISEPSAMIDLGLRRNITRVPSRNGIGRLLANRQVRKFASAILPDNLRGKAKSALLGIVPDRPEPLSREVEASLEKLFEADRLALQRLLWVHGIRTMSQK